MIKVDLSSALFLYLFLSVIITLLLWIFYNLGIKLKTFDPEESHIWHCSICAHTYVDSRNNEISNCSRCGSYIEKTASTAKTGGIE